MDTIEFNCDVVTSLIEELKSKGLLKELWDDIEFSIFELPNGDRLGYQGGAYLTIYEEDKLIFTHEICDLSKIRVEYYEDKIAIEFFKYKNCEYMCESIETYTCYTNENFAV